MIQPVGEVDVITKKQGEKVALTSKEVQLIIEQLRQKPENTQ